MLHPHTSNGRLTYPRLLQKLEYSSLNSFSHLSTTLKMCSAQSTFFYGVFVKTAYLCFASDAYKNIKSSLLGIDLICSRRRKGTLSTTGGHESVKSVPEEVWKMVKPRVADLAMVQAEQRAVSHYLGSYSCDDEEEWEYAHTWNSGVMNDWAIDDFVNNGGMSEMFGSRIEVNWLLRCLLVEALIISHWFPSQEVKTLLQLYGLVLPFTEPYSKDQHSTFDLECLSAISLPLVSTAPSTDTQQFPSTSLEPNADYGSVQGATMFSKQAFAVSTRDDHRIKSLLSFFGLQAESDKFETVYRPHQIDTRSSTSHATGSKTVKKKDSEATRKAAHKVCCNEPDAEPRWHMWTVSHCY